MQVIHQTVLSVGHTDTTVCSLEAP